MNEDFARQTLVSAGINPRYMSHGLSVLRHPRNIGREEAIARLLQRTSPNWFKPQRRVPGRPSRPPSFVRGPSRHRKDSALQVWIGHTCVPYSDEASEQFAKLASLQHQDVDGIEPELVGNELWLRAGGARLYVIPNPTPTETSDVIFQCRLAIWQAKHPNGEEQQ